MPMRTGTPGNDDYQGEVGLSDTADIQTSLAGATFSYTDAFWTVTSGVGQDRLFSIEQAQFSDALIALSLGGETRVDTTGSGRNAQVTALANGNYVVTFEVTDGSGTGIFSQIYSATGERIGVETRVNTTVSGNQTAPAIATLSGGGYAIAWASAVQDGSGTGVYMQRYDAAGVAVGGETLVNTYTTGDQGAPTITGLTSGRFVVTWQSALQDGSGNGLYMQRFNETGAVLGTETLVNTAVANGQESPAVATIAAGSYVVTWQSLAQDGSGYGVFAQRYSVNGVAQGAEFRVNTTTSLDQSAPSITNLASGGYVVTWQSNGQDGSGWGVFAQVFTAVGARVGGEIQINAFATNGQEAPVVTGLADGGFVVLWQSFGQDGGGYGVYAQRFDAGGARVGDEIRVNSNTFGDQMDPSVAALADGGFVVTWEGSGAGGSGIYSQRFGADGLPVLPKIAGDESPNVIVATGTTAVAIEGGEGDDTLTSGSGADILDGGLGRDTLKGGLGNDIYKADAGDRIVEAENGGVDTALVTANFTITSAYLENVTLTGAAAASLVGNGLDNVLTGNAADNDLNGLQGNDRMVGGRGNDTYVVDAAGDTIVEEADGGIDTVVSQIDYLLGDHEEILRLVGNAAFGTGNALDNQIIGNAASNRLDGGTGADLLVGAGGDDLYVVDADDQVLEEAGEGIDTVHASASWTLGDNLENVTLVGTGHTNATGNDLGNIVYGNSGNNILDGRGGADFMDGGGGNDIYYVDHADDAASETTNSIKDVVKASVTHALGTGIEELTLTGTAHIGGTGNSLDNVIRGNSGSNALDGSGGRDVLYGGYGNDRLTSADGLDRLIGGVGNDSYEVTGETDEIVELGEQGTDTVTAAVTRSYTLGLNLENLVLVGGNVDGYGNAGLNRITGTLGNNLIDGGEGADRLTGLAGDDTYIVDNRFDVIVEGFNAGVDRVLSSVGYTLGNHVEDLVLTGAGVLAGQGNVLANRITGNSAANALTGLGGNDLLVGAGGNDSLSGGDGNDRLNGGAGRDRLDGGAGVDLVTYFGVASGVTVDLAITVAQDTLAAGVDTLVGIEHLSGSNVGGDTMAGDGVANTLEGNGGDDVLGGAEGDDRVLGGEGDDVLTGGAGNDRLDGGNGIDKASFATSTVSVTIDLNLGGAQNSGEGLDTIVNVEIVEGSATAHDRLIGDFEDNELYGLGGNDILSGGDGEDRLDGGLGRDTADYSSAWDRVMVNLGTGIATDDGSGFGDMLVSIENLVGSEFGDLLIGGSGVNNLTGGLGRDVLRGGAGDDIFAFRTALESGITVETRDVIQDFAAGDRIDLSGMDANQATVADDAFATLLGADQAFTAAGQLRFANGVLFGNTDADAAAEFAIRLVDVTSITMTDFIL